MNILSFIYMNINMIAYNTILQDIKPIKWNLAFECDDTIIISVDCSS